MKASERLQALEQENKILQEKLAAQEKFAAEQKQFLGSGIDSEIRQINLGKKPGLDRLPYGEAHDHKNISLWTKLGKRIGPLHPDNAIRTLRDFASIGIILSTKRPTGEEIDAYMQTGEYKAFARKEATRRAAKDKSRKSGQIERLTAEIAKLTGQNAEALNRILSPGAAGIKA